MEIKLIAGNYLIDVCKNYHKLVSQNNLEPHDTKRGIISRGATKLVRHKRDCSDRRISLAFIDCV